MVNMFVKNENGKICTPFYKVLCSQLDSFLHDSLQGQSQHTDYYGWRRCHCCCHATVN